MSSRASWILVCRVRHYLRDGGGGGRRGGGGGGEEEEGEGGEGGRGGKESSFSLQILHHILHSFYFLAPHLKCQLHEGMATSVLVYLHNLKKS